MSYENDEFEFTPTIYTPTDQELPYLREALGELYAEQWFTDILYKVKGGKEATVYCLAAHPSTGLKHIAAKVYRPRMFRAMKNDSFYRIGRTTTGPDGKMEFRGRAMRALKKRTQFGREIEMASWNGHELRLLQELHAAGAQVPKPLAAGPNCILMEFLGDETQGAPTLHSLHPDRGQAKDFFEQLMRDVELMLSKFLVHGDLSPHNVLVHQDRPWIIDLPQAVQADTHPGAYMLLNRDVERLCHYFQKHGVECDAGKITASLWSRFMRGPM